MERTWLTAGWRPFTGWVCGISLAYQYIINPTVAWYMVLTTENPVYPPTIDLALMMPVLLGLLGLAGYRTTEKIKGVTK